MIHARSLVASFTLMTATSLAAAPEPSDFRPSGPWNVHYEANQCLAGREYTSGKKQLTFGIESRPMAQGMAIMVMVPGRSNGLEFRTADVDLGEGARKKQHIIAALAQKKGMTVYRYFADGPAAAELARSQRFKMKAGSLNVDLLLPDFSSAMKAMDECKSDLLAAWGFGEQAQARLATPPRPASGRSMFSADDYPQSAVDRGGVGEAQALIHVGADGNVARCQIAVSSGHPDIDEATCRSITKRGKFEPALDRDGKPMEAPYMLPVMWQISG